jgi:hypothetical protein
MINAMRLDIGPHLDEAEIEQYSMGTLPAERIVPFEEHLMACNSCQDQLLEMEAYVNAVRSVSPKLRPAEKSRWLSLGTQLSRAPVWAGTAATLAALFLIARLWTAAPDLGPVAIVQLQASRGMDGSIVAGAVAGQSLSLQIDPMELSVPAPYRLEIVQSMGKQVVSSEVAPKDGKIVLLLAKGLPAGKYYVRLYAQTSELLREYGLQVR